MRLLLAAVLTLAACASTAPSQTLSLSTDRSRYAAGTEATLTLRNGSDSLITHGVLACAPLERRSGAGWEDATMTGGNARVCAAVIEETPAGETRSVTIPLYLPPGTYRFAFPVARGESQDTMRLTTDPFEVM